MGLGRPNGRESPLDCCCDLVSESGQFQRPTDFVLSAPSSLRALHRAAAGALKVSAADAGRQQGIQRGNERHRLILWAGFSIFPSQGISSEFCCSKVNSKP